MAMQEFLLWENCTNKCDFCWQCKINDQTTFLNEKEMILSIKETCKMLDSVVKKGDDILLVGGEILNSYYNAVDKELQNLIDKCVNMIKNKYIRFLYINTNLIYDNRVNLEYLFNAIKGYEDKLKFTSSYDIYGRFKDDKVKNVFLENLLFIKEKYPKINTVINCIITKQLAESNFDITRFKIKYGLKHINLIPYIPVLDNRCMDVSFKDIVKVLARAEKNQHGYIDFYIKDFDYNQDKILYQYHKNTGYKECTSKYLDCHHNENFKKVLNGDCFICKLKEVFC